MAESRPSSTRCPKCEAVCKPGDNECEDCGYPFNRPTIRFTCQICESPRRINRRGVYTKYCSECGYEYEGKCFVRIL